MDIKAPLLKILNQVYEPDSVIERPFKRYDAVFKTDNAGRPVLLFLGKRDANGRIRGERFSRRLKIDEQGKVIKDHWERKGKAD